MAHAHKLEIDKLISVSRKNVLFLQLHAHKLQKKYHNPRGGTH